MGGGIILAYRIGTGDLENRSHLPKVTELGRGGVWVGIWVVSQSKVLTFVSIGQALPLLNWSSQKEHVYGEAAEAERS